MNEKEISNAYGLLKAILNCKESKTYTEIVEAAKQAVNIVNSQYKSELFSTIVDLYQENIGVKAYNSEVLNRGYKNDWFYEKKKTIKLNYFNRYKEYLNNKDFPLDAIEKMEKGTEEILSYCANPNDESDIKNRSKKGLVMGDVQSGKTANYISLINMAADYGYKVIVLLAGLTESLRIQTQKRIDEGFIGAISDSIGSLDIKFVGVGEETNNYFSIPMTNQRTDFNKTAINNNTTANDYAKPLVFVVKKNKNVLQQMSDWLKPAQINFSSKNILIIDDEADNASVNTRDEYDPSTINKLIRNMYNNFPIATYIGFTATPFANIFIDPYDDETNKDLFPSDFIVQLKAPNTYFGINKIFNTSNGSYEHIRVLDEDEHNFLAVKHKKDDYISNTIPNSMKEAIFDFLIANVVRTLRGDIKAHRTMMINISRFNKVQDKIEDNVRNYLFELKMVIEQTYKLSFDEFIMNEELNSMYNYYKKDDFYAEIRKEISWDQLQANIFDEIDKVQIKVFKNGSKNKFNYDEYKDEGARLIAIGGFVLSRGLTLEGLIISYYSRSSNAYDTILQMCRWFGYRIHYEDLCRIYMSSINIDCFQAVIEAVSDLKQQFTRMKAMGKKPVDYGLSVKESPDTLETMMLITSRNKMKSTKEIERTLNYSGQFVDTSKLFFEESKIKSNYTYFIDMVNELKENGILLEKVDKRFMFRNVNKILISKFIKNISIPMENKRFNKECLSEFIKDSNEFTNWDIVIATGDSNGKIWDICKNQIHRPSRSFDVRNNENFIRISGNKNRLVEPGIFDSGLTKQQINDLKIKNDGKPLIARDYLSIKNRNPLLAIYPILLNINEVKLSDDIDKTFDYKIRDIINSNENVLLGFAVGFPGVETNERVRYRVNMIKYNEEDDSYFDECDDEEDLSDE